MKKSRMTELDKMVIKSRERGVSYGKLQAEETLERMKRMQHREARK